MVGLGSTAYLQRLGLERFHCNSSSCTVRMYMQYVRTAVTPVLDVCRSRVSGQKRRYQQSCVWRHCIVA